MQAAGVEIDNAGIRAETALDQGVQAMLITPRAYNPTGCSPSERARAP